MPDFGDLARETPLAPPPAPAPDLFGPPEPAPGPFEPPPPPAQPDLGMPEGFFD